MRWRCTTPENPTGARGTFLSGVIRDRSKVSAANAILDRGRGRAAQAIQNGEDGAFELIQRIERYTFKAVITIIVTGFVGAVWLGIKVMLGK
jgi:hypothetical protein